MLNGLSKTTSLLIHASLAFGIFVTLTMVKLVRSSQIALNKDEITMEKHKSDIDMAISSVCIYLFVSMGIIAMSLMVS